MQNIKFTKPKWFSNLSGSIYVNGEEMYNEPIQASIPIMVLIKFPLLFYKRKQYIETPASENLEFHMKFVPTMTSLGYPILETILRFAILAILLFNQRIPSHFYQYLFVLFFIFSICRNLLGATMIYIYSSANTLVASFSLKLERTNWWTRGRKKSPYNLNLVSDKKKVV